MEGAPSKITPDYISRLRRSCRNRESYDELAELEAELRRAYTTKELEAQIAEREADRVTENVRKHQEAELTRLRQQVALEEDLRRRSAEHGRSKDLRKQLEEQMTRRQLELRIEREKAREERRILEEVDRTRETLERSEILRRKTDGIETARRELRIMREIKEIRLQQEREEETRKELRDQEYLLETERRTMELKEMRREQQRRREECVERIASSIMDAQIRGRHREELMLELVAEDVRQEMAIREKEAEVSRRRRKEELAAGLAEQIVFTERCKMRFVERDREFAEGIMRKIMEDEKTARLTAEARRRVQLQYREELAGLIEERRRIREREIARIEEEAREAERGERIRTELVREERRRLLEEHATNVADFVRKGALNLEELAIVEESSKNRRNGTGEERGTADDRMNS